MTDYAKLAQLLFPHVTQTPQQLMEAQFPPRQLKDGAQVTRFAPAPLAFCTSAACFPPWFPSGWPTPPEAG